MLKYLFYILIYFLVLIGQLHAHDYRINTKDMHLKMEKVQEDQSHNKHQRYPNKFIILGCRPQGMFSIFDDVFDAIKRYELGECKGVEIDFAQRGVYYEPSCGKNWWSYYFKPINIGRKQEIKHLLGKPPHVIFLKTEALYRKEIFELIKKYFQVKPHVQKKIDALEKELFKDHFVISVHYRGTDKTIEAPAVSYEKVAEEVVKIMKKYGNKKYKIFVATDEQAFLDYMIHIFGDIVCYNKDALRSTNGKPVHLDKKLSRYKAGEDAVIDCMLLSKGDILIRTSSNLSRWSTYFNPHIPVIKLNTQFVYEK